MPNRQRIDEIPLNIIATFICIPVFNKTAKSPNQKWVIFWVKYIKLVIKKPTYKIKLDNLILEKNKQNLFDNKYVDKNIIFS